MLGILRTEACNRKCSTTVAFGIEAAVVLVGDGRPQSAWCCRSRCNRLVHGGCVLSMLAGKFLGQPRNRTLARTLTWEPQLPTPVRVAPTIESANFQEPTPPLGDGRPSMGPGHVALRVANVERTCKYLAEANVQVFRAPGHMTHSGRQRQVPEKIAFVADLDGYRLETIDPSIAC